MSANDTQVGGSHYRTDDGSLQHWDLVARYGVGYLEGCATKYVSRWRKKNGLEDLRKGLHYIDKILELHDEGILQHRGVAPRTKLYQWAKTIGMEQIETDICELVLCVWRGPLATPLRQARQMLVSLIEGVPGTPADGGHHA